MIWIKWFVIYLPSAHLFIATGSMSEKSMSRSLQRTLTMRSIEIPCSIDGASQMNDGNDLRGARTGMAAATAASLVYTIG